MTRWFVPLRADQDRVDGPARVRLLVFPHAGGGPASLAEFAPLLPPEIEPWSVNLPGRQARLAEPPRTDLEPLAESLAAELKSFEGAPCALFGYCSGALLAYLVCRRLEEQGGSAAGLLVGSFAAPDIAALPRRLHLLPSDLFWERLIEYGGVPDELAERADLRPVLEPALRADFGMLASYRHVPGPPLAAPVTVLHGKHDTSLTRGALLGWRRQATSRPALREIDASHWLVEDAPEELAAAIAEQFD